jgi:hypothetical protein
VNASVGRFKLDDQLLPFLRTLGSDYADENRGHTRSDCE